MFLPPGTVFLRLNFPNFGRKWTRNRVPRFPLFSNYALEEALLHKTLCLRTSLDGASGCWKCINSFLIVLKRTIPKVNSSWHMRSKTKHHSRLTVLPLSRHAKSMSNWCYVHIKTASHQLSFHSDKNSKVLCNKHFLSEFRIFHFLNLEHDKL